MSACKGQVLFSFSREKNYTSTHVYLYTDRDKKILVNKGSIKGSC